MNDDAHTEVARHTRKNLELIDLENAMQRNTFDLSTAEALAPDELKDAQTKLVRAAIQSWFRKQMSGFGTRPPIPIRKPQQGSGVPRQGDPAAAPDPIATP
jgi:hypothetical protein